MRPGDFRVGDWLVQPSLDRVERDGRVVHLRPKTMQVLAELADHAGEVVPRDDLQRTVWRDVHVSEESLSHCIAEIRSVFGDDVHEPKYVETVAKHGYRLIAPVRREPNGGATMTRAAQPNGSRRSTWTPRRMAAVAAVVVLAVAALASFVRRARTAAENGPPQLIVLAEWENRTGDPVFDVTLRQALAVALGESATIKLASRDRIAQALRLMRFPADARLTADVARQVCRRIGADLVAAGEIAKLGEQFVVLVELTGCSSATPIGQIRERAAGKEAVLVALDRAAASIRLRLGAVPPASADGARPLEDVTTANLEALRAFTLATDALDERRAAEAIALFDHAVELDPDFALAHSRLGTTLAALREWKHANEHRRRAMELAAGLTERERLYVNAAYKLGLGRVAEAEDTLRTWARLFPADRVPLGWLAVCHLNRGEQAEALTWGQAAVKVDPAPGTLVNLAAVYLNAGRIADAKSLTAGLNEPGFRYLLAFLDGDRDEMDRQRSAVEAGSAEELDMRAREAQAAMAAGRVTDARHLLGRAEALGLQLGLQELTAQIMGTQALWEAEVGDARLAVEMAAASLSLGENSSTRALAVLTFARSRATARALAILKMIDSGPSEIDAAIDVGSRHKLAAALALALDRPDEALRQLESVPTYENGGVVNHVALRGDVAELGVFHLRGQARLALGQGAEAAAEFRRIIDKRGVSPLSPYSALAPLNLARAQALAGNVAAARRSYDVFLQNWSGADPDSAFMADVKREYQRLPARAAGSSK
jgi:DNA-binding winged helix-turn-helix (wHTH) protein/tetratricopeptide (TPR) repeat protein